jgi:hypothetical protein
MLFSLAVARGNTDFLKSLMPALSHGCSPTSEFGDQQ